MSRLLVIDIDETLGSFHLQFEPIYRRYCKHPKINIDVLLTMIVKHFVRPGIISFFKQLDEYKQKGLIDRICFWTLNSNHNDYVRSLTKYILKYTDTENLVSDEDIFYRENVIEMDQRLRFVFCIKDLRHFFRNDYKKGTIYMIDNKPSSIIPNNRAIAIDSYFIYVNPKIIADYFPKEFQEKVLKEFTELRSSDQSEESFECNTLFMHELSKQSEHDDYDIIKHEKEIVIKRYPKNDKEFKKIFDEIKGKYK